MFGRLVSLAALACASSYLAEAKGLQPDSDLIYYTEKDAIYYTATDDVAVVNFRLCTVSFAAFVSENPEFKMSADENEKGDAISIDKMREALSKHVKASLFVINRSPGKGEPFDDQWDHLQSVLAYKAVKDTLIRDHILVHGVGSEASKTIDLMTVKRLFFDSYAPDAASLDSLRS